MSVPAPDALRILQNELSRLDHKMARRELYLTHAANSLRSMKEEAKGFRHSMDVIASTVAKKRQTERAAPGSQSELDRAPTSSETPSREQTSAPAHAGKTEPNPLSNVGYALRQIREAGSRGLTSDELIDKSIQHGRPLKWANIGSQIRKLIERGFVRQEGDRYIAN